MSDDHTNSPPALTLVERPRDPAPAEGIPLSAMQRSVWLDDQLHPGSTRFHISSAVRVFSEVDAESARAAFESVVGEHAALRTTFDDVGGTPCQRVHDAVELDLRYVDASDWDEAHLDEELTHAHRRPFDLATGPPVRFSVLRRGAGEHIAVITIHHIVADMWSQALLGHAVITAFQRGSSQALVNGARTRAGSDRSWTYRDYVEHEIYGVDSRDSMESTSYWRDLFDAWTPPSLPTDRPALNRPTGTGDAITRSLDPALAAKIDAFSREHDVSVRSVVLFAFQTVLARMGGGTDVIVAEVKANRNLRLARSIGCFINQVPRRLAFDDSTTCAHGVVSVENQIRASRAHDSLPFDHLLRELRPTHGAEPFFQAAFAWQKTTRLVTEQLATNLALGRTADTTEHEGLRLQPVSMPSRSAPLPISLLGGTTGGQIHVTFEFQVDRFDRSTIESLMQRFEAVLLAMVDRPDTAIADIDLVTAEERSRWADASEQSRRPFDESATALHLIGDRIAATPHAVALRFGDERITYAELNHRARLLASRLHDAQVQPGDLVGLCQRRSPDLVSSILATWMVGAAYVPMDPEFPPQRLSMMMADADVRVVVTNGDLWNGLRDAVGLGSDPTVFDELAVVDLDAPDESVPSEPLELPDVTGTDAAYTGFTSGSTGRPKGIVAEHRNVANFARAMARRPGMTVDDCVLASTTLSFDPSVLELIVPLTVGATIELIDRSTTLDLARLATTLDRVTIAQATPTSWKMLIDDGWVGNPDLTVLCGGEPLTPTLSRQLSSRCRTLWNVYGPTETTVWSSVGRVDPSAAHISIGEPIDNARFVVLDESRRRCPDGVAGELWIGGAGVARGYLGRDDLTAERFVEDPAGEGHGTMYRTGDIVRQRAIHGIEFVGRVDNQVKIRGHRIELGEIEATLNTHPNITHSIVTTYTPTNDPTDTRLAAYITTNTLTTTDDIRTHAATTLPTHMIPTAIIHLDQLPLTPNNKIDRTRLPQPTTTTPTTPHEPPQPGLETRIADIWNDVLDTNHIGRHDDFFQLGGHSLLATIIASRVRSVESVDLDVRAVFEHPTVAALAARVKGAPPAAIDPGPSVSAAPHASRRLSFSQEQMWLLHQLEPGGAGHNIAGGVRLKGPLDVDALRKSLDRVVDRHVAFRTVFGEHDGVAFQSVIDPETPVSFTDVDLSAAKAPVEAMRAEMSRIARQSFDLTKPPLARFVIYRLGTDDHAVLAVIHHIVCDQWSLGVLADEMAECYRAETRGSDAMFADIVLDADVYTERTRTRVDDQEYARQLDYWRRHLADVSPLKLPSDRPRTGRRSNAADTVRRPVPSNVIETVERFAKAMKTSPYVVFLSAYQVLLRRYSRQTDVAIGTAVADRPDVASENLVAMLVNTVVIRTELDDRENFERLVERTHQTALDARAHHDVPFLDLVAETATHRHRNQQPLAQVFFNLRRTPFDGAPVEGIAIEPIELDVGTGQFDLSLAIDIGAETTARITYASDLFDRHWIDSMVDHYWTILRSLTEAPTRPTSQAAMLTDDEVQALESERTVHDTGETPSLAPERFRQMVELHGDRAAVRTALGRWTYRELATAVDSMAVRLRDEIGVTPGDRVGVHLEASVEAIVVVQSLWTLGAVHVPLDPADPTHRVEVIARDARLVGVVTTTPGAWSGVPIPTIVASASDLRSEVAVGIEPHTCRADDVAYIIYTSGSSGTPKGVVIEHANLANFVESTSKRPGVTHEDVVVASTPPAFDASLRELVVPFAVGAEVVPIARDITRDAEAFARAMTGSGATIAKATPTTWSMLIDAGWNGGPGIRVLSGGEPLDRALADRLSSRSAEVWNVYGPTEGTINSTIHRVQPGDGPVPIGEPIDNTTLHVLDECEQPVPDGVTGELYISGAGVARGYLDRPELTVAVFTPDPHRPSLRRYKTGDLVRRDRDGTHHYVGRVDEQVKIRGHRIELGEIEATLNTHPNIAQSIVTTYTPTNDPTDTRLAAYITTNTLTTTDDIRTHAATTLPTHMIPTAIIHLDQLPLTPNNKIDRTRLPQPTTTTPTTPHEPPQPGLETRIADIWNDVLDTNHIGRHDDFFQLGGHSLLALKAFSRLAAENPHQVPLSAMFQAPTVASLAAAFTRGEVDRDWTSLVEIHAGGTRPPFFYVSPFMISVLAFSHLGRHLGLDQPVYCLQPQGLEQRASVHTTVEQMAAHYLAEIRQVQPDGPYYLGGHCAGSIVAYEMTRQLQAAGERVQLLLLVDSRPPNTGGVARHPRRTLRHLLTRVRHYARTGRLLDSLLWVTAIALDQLWVRHFGDAVSRRAAMVRSIHAKAHSRYESGPILGDATLIRSEEWMSLPDKNWHLEWSDLLGGKLHVKMIPGTHAGLVENVNSEALAQYISESIAESQGTMVIDVDTTDDKTTAGQKLHRTSPIEPPPLVSIVIPTFNRRERLDRVLGALAEQTYPAESIEVIVISDGSTDDTDEYLAGGRTPLPVIAHLQDNAGPAVARNNGVERATGDIVLFLDDDVIPTPELVSRHVESHTRSTEDIVVIGPMLTPPDHPMSPWVRWEQAMLQKQYEAMRKGRWTATARQFYTGNASMARTLFVRSGGFDESFRRAEDVELAYRLERENVEFEMNLDAIGFHYAVRSFDSWIAIASAYGSANVIFGRDHGRTDLLRTIARDHRRRNPLNRFVSWLGVRSERFAGLASTGLGRLAGVAEERHWERISRYSLSGIYNIAYCRGVSDELGGAHEFGRFIRRHNPLLKPLTRLRIR